MSTPTADMRALPVRACSIECIAHPEWGSFGVMEDSGLYYEIHGSGGSRVLSKDEAARFWRVRSPAESRERAAPSGPESSWAVEFPRHVIHRGMRQEARWVAYDLNVIGAHVNGDEEYLRGITHRESTELFRRALGGVYQAVQHAHADELRPFEAGSYHADELRPFEAGAYVSEAGESGIYQRYSENPEAYQEPHGPELLSLAQQLNAVALFQASATGNPSELVAAIRGNPELKEAIAGLCQRAAKVAKLAAPQASEQFVYEEMGLRFWFDHPNQVLRFSRLHRSEFAPPHAGDSPAMTLDEVYSEAGNDYFTAAQLTHILGQARQIMPPAAFATLKARALQGDECWMERSTRRDELIARKLSERGTSGRASDHAAEAPQAEESPDAVSERAAFRRLYEAVANTKADVGMAVESAMAGAQRFLEPGKRTTRASARTR